VGRDTRFVTDGRVDGLVVAGGRSQRFGTDKRVAVLRGEELIRRAVRTLRAAVGGAVFVATGRKRERLPGTARAVVIVDEPPGRGPLGGIAAALRRAHVGVVVLGCDLPFVRPTTLERVAAAGLAAGRPAAVRSARGWEPLVAYWPAPVYKHVRAALEQGALAPHELLDRLGAVAVTGVAPGELHNVNTREDLQRAAARR
jgi:molybdopterin-guanine dinucleotide biosynthesis protein A